jgi:ribose 5-phosphate isomerase RpiB
MKIAVVTESSTSAKNTAIIEALADTGREHEIFNLGMTGKEGEPELLIYETGFLTALLLNLGCVDFVIGGCGTGQGYFNCAVQFPGVVCGLILDDVDAWVYPRINSGNCVSLALNKGYGWAGEMNLRFIFEKLFTADFGCGYPSHRKEPQKKIREKLAAMSVCTHKEFADIIQNIEQEIWDNVIKFPGILDFLRLNTANKKSSEYLALITRVESD